VTAGGRDHNRVMDDRVEVLSLSETDRNRLSFLVAAHGLTSVQRLNRLLDGSRRETSAEHSWHLALSAIVLQDYAGPTVQIDRVLRMLLVHDIVEVDAGDVPIYDEADRTAIAEAEERAARRLFALLPEPDASAHLALWREFEDAQTDDARFARALDRLQPVLVHWAGGGSVWRERRITEQQERRILELINQYWPSLMPLAAALVDDAVACGMLVAS
jgi:putative hydrolase of HD superfamily